MIIYNNHAVVMHKPVAFLLAGFLLSPAASLLAATQSASAEKAGKEERLASDKDIALAVEKHLTVDAATPAHLIDVEVKDGIVTLSGSVANLLIRDRAGDLAETIRGVRSVVNTIMVNPVKRADEAIAKDAKYALAKDPATHLYQAGVQVMNGTAILTGTVDSLAERDLAAQVVKGVRGVKAVKNSLVVKPKLKRADNEVAADIQGMLKQDPWVDASAIDVSVKDGVATLKGSVASLIEQTSATQDAWVAGVLRVNNDGLTVKPGGATARASHVVDDKEIKQLIETAMKQHPRLASFEPEVESNNHIVTLRGKVDNFAAKKVAEEIARNTTGVTQVENHIRVRPEKLSDDAALAKEVKSALLRDPYVSRFDMNVSAANAKVYLEGRVDSGFQRRYAEFIAARVPGVVDVRNNLRVTDLEVPYKTDGALQQEIEYGLRWSPFIEGQGIAVSVEDGIALLSGNASSWQAKLAATQVARRAGAESVLNQVQVKEQLS
jgi:osmotically-inducible protein OsmY